MADDQTAQGFSGLLKLPATTRSPWWRLAIRLLIAIGILVFTVADRVWFDRERLHRRRRTRPHKVGLVDSIYYTTVTLSTTGYGDIAPVSDTARAWSTRSSSRRCASRSWCC